MSDERSTEYKVVADVCGWMEGTVRPTKCSAAR